MLRAGGAILEASPRYIAAVKAQRVRDDEARRLRAIEQAKLKTIWQAREEQAKLDAKRREKRAEQVAVQYRSGQQLPARAIITAIAHQNGYTYSDIISKSRNRKLVAVRQHAMRAVKQAYPCKSLPELGRIFERDHTTLLHALRKGETNV